MQTQKKQEVHIEPPKDLREFEDRLGKLMLFLKGTFFGLTYDIEERKTLKKDTGPETLVRVLQDYEKYRNAYGEIFHNHLEAYQFLKLALESNTSLIWDDRYLLEISRDRSGLMVPDKKELAVQCAAQVLWYLEGDKFLTIMDMEQCLKTDPRLQWLNARQFQKARTIWDWIRPICPISEEDRKKPSHQRNREVFKELIPIPGIITESGGKVNFPKLRFVILSLSFTLKGLGWSLDQVRESNLIALYAVSLRFYPALYVGDWVKEAFENHCSILGPQFGPCLRQ